MGSSGSPRPVSSDRDSGSCARLTRLAAPSAKSRVSIHRSPYRSAAIDSRWFRPALQTPFRLPAGDRTGTNRRGKRLHSMHVSGLFIHPVKSLRAVSVPSVELDALGIVGDRRFMVVDENGRFLTQRSLSRMALVETTLTRDELILST